MFVLVLLLPGASDPEREVLSRLGEAQKHCQSDSQVYRCNLPKWGRFWLFQWNMSNCSLPCNVQRKEGLKHHTCVFKTSHLSDDVLWFLINSFWFMNSVMLFFLIKRFHCYVFCIFSIDLIQINVGMVMVYIIILGNALIVDILFILV